MPYDQNGDEYEEESHEPRSNFWSKLMNHITRNDEDDEMYEDEPRQPQQRPVQAVNSEAATVARVPAPHRAAGGSLNPMRKSATISQLRLERERPTTITVRRTVQSFEDVRRAIDGLREGVQQIVNIEQTPVDIAERLIDFLNGATYALDGSVEKIGNQVYLFTPNNVMIDVEDMARTAPAKPFFDRDL